jgi:predicted nucleic acid-binding protein
MRAVSNTSPISNLAAIGRLWLLKSQFSEIWTPAAVSQELDAHPDPTALEAIHTAFREAWIKPAPAPESHLLDILCLYLHRGEAETIALGSHLRVDLVIIDEQEGRQFALATGLGVTGVLGILLRAKQSGQIPAIRPEIQSLREKARFFIAPSLEAKLLAAAGE